MRDTLCHLDDRDERRAHAEITLRVWKGYSKTESVSEKVLSTRKQGQAIHKLRGQDSSTILWFALRNLQRIRHRDVHSSTQGLFKEILQAHKYPSHCHRSVILLKNLNQLT